MVIDLSRSSASPCSPSGSRAQTHLLKTPKVSFPFLGSLALHLLGPEETKHRKWFELSALSSQAS